MQCPPTTRVLLIGLLCAVFWTAVADANINVLIIGSTKDSGERHSTGVWWNNLKPAFVPKSKAFSPTEIRTQLSSILGGAGMGTVNVTLEERYRSDAMPIGWTAYSYNLASWFHYPYPAGAETARWANLRGEAGTVWDYIVLIGDPYTMEYTPGMYAQGVAKIAEEVAKSANPAQLILLMPWPGSGSTSSVNHYKEMVYRTGRSGGIMVAPAALAWQAAGSPSGTSHPTTAGAFIAASSIYSCMTNQSARASTYVYNDANADIAYNTYLNNKDAVQYTGNITFQNPYLFKADPRRKIYFTEKGTSTEQYFKGAIGTAGPRAKVEVNGAYSDKYSSDTPEDDGLGWPTNVEMPLAWNMGRDGISSEDYKSYVTNPAYWQLAYGFYYQQNTWSYPVEEANDIHIGLMQMHDHDLANRMLNEGPTARNLPVRMLWAQIHKEFPTLNPQLDGSGPHLSLHESEAAGCYMFTLYSGRCPLDPKPATPDENWVSRRIGYETAWRLGRCQTRAPGFKVMPSAYNKLNIAQNTSETMTVQFILPPQQDVTVNVSVSSPTAAIVGAKKLVFTPQNYDTPQNVTITALPGATASDVFNVVFTTTSADEVYNNLQDSWEYTATRSVQALTQTTVATTAVSTYKNLALEITHPVAAGTSANTILAGPSHGTCTWSGNHLLYTPDADYSGPDGIAYAVNASGTLSTGYIDITVINAIPDKLIAVSATDASAGEPGSNTGTWTFTRTGSTAASLQINYTVSGTATSGADYTALPTSVTFPIGASTVTRTVTPLDDGVYEGSETVTLTITPSANYIASSAPNNSATVTINDNDLPTITVAATDTVCAEAGTADVGVFTLTRSGANTLTLTVNYTLGGAAINGADYTSLAGAVTFAAGSSTATVTITPTNDTAYEGPEDVILSLAADATYVLGAPSSASLTLADNDKPTVSIASSLTTTQEGGANPVLTFSRTGATGVGPLTVVYALSGSASMGADYGLLSGTFTIPQNQSSASITVPVLQDDIGEIPETFTVTISTNAAYNKAASPDSAATITIADDASDPLMVGISATDSTASEPLKGDGAGLFTITRSRDTGMALTVGLLAGGTATAGSDHEALPATVTIPSGQTSATVTLTALDDAEAEIDETVSLTLQGGSGYVLGTTTAASINLYDDEPVQVRMEIGDAKCIEQASPDSGTFILRRLGNRSNALTVNVTVAGTATPGGDYTALTSSYAINANNGSATVTVTPIDNTVAEGTETVILTLAAGSVYVVNAQNTATLEIREDETVDVTVAAQDANCAEQATADTGTFRISRSASSASALTVSYTLTGTAANGADYTTLSGTATIPANATLVDIPLTPIQDNQLEGSESVIMTLTGAGANYDIGDARSVTIWIKDDETPWISLAATDAAAAEADGGTTNQGLYTFTASFAPAGDLAVQYTVSANNGIDCAYLPGSIVIPAGQTSVTLPLIPVDDELAEGAENVGVTLVQGDGYGVASLSTVNVSIAASDAPQATFIALDPNATENPVKTGRIMVCFTRTVVTNTTVNYTVGGSATSAGDYTALSGTVTVGGGSNSAIITVTPLDDALAEATETIVLTLGANGSLYTIGSPSSATVNLIDDETVPPLMTWKQTSFGSSWTDEALAGDAADADGDGLGNLLEYAFGSDPNQNTGAAARPQAGEWAGALSLGFTRVVANNDITIIIQAANAPGGPWTDLASSVNGAATTALVGGVSVTESGSGATRSVAVRDLYAKNDPAHPRRFMRISVQP